MSPKAQVAAGLLSSDDVEEVTQGGVKVTQVKAGREIDATKLTESQQKAVMEARKAGSATKTESAPASSMERYRDAIKKEESRLSKKYSGNYESAVVSEAKTDYGKKIAQRAHDNAQKAIEVFKTNKEQGLKLRDEAIKDWTSLGESRYGIKAKVSPILTKMAVEKLDKSLGIKELSWSEKRARTAGLSKQTVNIKKKNSDGFDDSSYLIADITKTKRTGQYVKDYTQKVSELTVPTGVKVNGVSKKGWGIHKTENDYSITHLKSGTRLASRNSMKDAKKIVDTLITTNPRYANKSLANILSSSNNSDNNKVRKILSMN